MADNPQSLHPHRNGWHHLQTQVCHLPHHPYHAQQRTNIDLKTFFVFPDTNEEMEDVEDEMETDEDIQDTAGLEEEVPSDDEENNSQ
jgi:hypothetical protein